MWAFVLAALAGVATILSPCVQPMLPSVHTPEYGYERVGANVREAVQRLGIHYPVVQDRTEAQIQALLAAR